MSTNTVNAENVNRESTLPMDTTTNVLQFKLSSAVPSAEEAQKLCQVPVVPRGISSKEVKQRITWMLLYLVLGVAMYFFGSWVLRKFTGLGVIFFGALPKYVAPPIMLIMSIYSFLLIFKSSKFKTAEKALNWLILSAYIGDDNTFAISRFGNKDYALATLERSLPKAIGFDAARGAAGIAAFRNLLDQSCEARANAHRRFIPVKADPNKLNPSIKIVGQKYIWPSVLEMDVIIDSQDVLVYTENNKT